MHNESLRKFFACLTLLLAASACSFEEQPTEQLGAEKAVSDVRAARQSVVLGGTCAADGECIVDDANSVCNTTTLKCECAPCFEVGGGGTCVPIVCASDLCKTSSCDAGTSACVDVPRNNGDGCTDPGTGAVVGCTNTCSAGSCSGAALTCTGTDLCKTAACSPATGACVDTPRNNGTGCTDPGSGAVLGCANTCNAGSCSGATLNCTGTDFCKTAACDAGTGACADAPKNEGLGCEPGAAATVGCSSSCAAGSCTGTSKTATCDLLDDQCANYTCAAGTGTCGTPAPTGNTHGCQISGGKAVLGCTGTCQANGSCGGTSQTSICDGLDSRCRDESCNAGTGDCDVAAINTGNGCVSDASTSAGCAGICQANGSCTTSPSMSDYCSITQATGNPCTLNQCQAASGTCSIINLSVSCDDGQACTTGTSSCDSGFCRGGTEVDSACDSGRPICGISDCRAASSSNATAGCYYTPIAAGAFQCAAADVSACKRAVSCNGTDTFCPAAANANPGTVCGATPTACGTGQIIQQAVCNGTGTCQAPAVVSCNGYACYSPAAVPTCKTSCSNDTDCNGTHYCNGTTCTPKTAPGQACTATNQCSTGICSFKDGAPGLAAGVCCNTPCDGTCQSCNGAGNCVATTGAPVGPNRTACSTHPFCGGGCNGVDTASCTYANVGQECDAAECTTDGSTGEESYQARATCSVAGTCPGESDPVSCAGLVCDLAIPGCLGGCSTDQDCTADGTYCPNPGVPCTTQKPLGADCTRNGECENGTSCIDGVCCGSTCSGLCEACNVAGSKGTCTPTPSGTQPVGARPDCGGSGSCAGACGGTDRFACAFPNSSTSCSAGACAGATATPAGSCDGAGSCATGTGVDCAPGACTAGLCDGDCSQCTATQYCVANKCVQRLANGAACVLGDDCQGGNCVDGVCCDTGCTGQCEACNVIGSEGVCSALPAGGAPRGARTACATDGSSCAGSCDGTLRTACAYPDQALECGAASCDELAGVATLARLCQGNGSCSAAQAQVCPIGPTRCAGAICAGGCTGDGDCTAGQYCAGGVCIVQPALGDACSLDTQCASGFCVDGVCCDTACTGACEECGDGSCGFRSGAPLPGRIPCDGTGPCGGLCDGTAASCATPGVGVSCGAANCVGGYAVGTSTCDGNGQCSAATGSVCADGLLCDGPVCATDCVDDSDCATALVCTNGACAEPVEPPGTGGTTGAGGANGSGGTTSAGGSTATGGSDAEGGEGGSLIPGIDQGTCGCSVPGQSSGDAGRLWLLGLAVAGVALRRRASSRRQSAA